MSHRNKRIEKIFHLTDSIKEELLQVWEESVRSSHHFLTEDDICYYRIRLKEAYLQAVELYVIRDKRIVAFIVPPYSTSPYITITSIRLM